jgi:hypothetical protein
MNKNNIVESLLSDSNDAFVVGEKVFIRTITYHLTGRITGIKECHGVGFLVLDEAAWIANDGRFTPAIEEGTLEEIEPVTGIVRVNVSSIIDCYVWRHPLPRNQK